MVSKASEDLPEPETPVTTVNALCGISKSTFLRLWTRAPRTTMLSLEETAILTCTEPVQERSSTVGPWDVAESFHYSGERRGGTARTEIPIGTYFHYDSQKVTAAAQAFA